MPPGTWPRKGRAKTKWDNGPEGHETMEVIGTAIGQFDIVISAECACKGVIQGTSATDSGAKQSLYRHWKVHWGDDNANPDIQTPEVRQGQ